jgi:hypothetical protein
MRLSAVMPDSAIESAFVSARLLPVVNVRDRDEWYTPSWIFDAMDITFDLDVAAPPGGVPWIPATHHYTCADDGLLCDWTGLVWCNPPYSDPLSWARRWAGHPEGALLVRGDLSTRAGQTAFGAASSFWAPARRLAFVNHLDQPYKRDGKNDQAPFTTVMFGRGPTADAALLRLAQRTGITRKMG